MGNDTSTQEIARRYDKWSPFYDFADRLGPLSGQERKWRSIVAGKVQYVRGWVLDAACGTGVMTSMIKSRSFRGRLIAIDVSLKMAEKTYERAKRIEMDVSVVLADVDRLPLKSECLGGIICTFSITTVRNPGKVVSEFERALSPGSKLIVLDSEKPDQVLVRLVYPALVPISRIFCHTHIDRDIEGLLEGKRELVRENKTVFLGGMVAVYEYKKSNNIT